MPTGEDEGGHGFVTFIIIVIVLAILGALAYVLHKINKGKEQSYSFVKYGQGQNITVDGLMDLNGEKKSDIRVLPNEVSHDEEDIKQNTYGIN